MIVLPPLPQTLFRVRVMQSYVKTHPCCYSSIGELRSIWIDSLFRLRVDYYETRQDSLLQCLKAYNKIEECIWVGGYVNSVLYFIGNKKSRSSLSPTVRLPSIFAWTWSGYEIFRISLIITFTKTASSGSLMLWGASKKITLNRVNRPFQVQILHARSTCPEIT